MLGLFAYTCYRWWTKLSSRTFTIFVKGAFYHFGRRSAIRLPIRLAGPERISIGEDVYLGSGSWIAVRGGEAEMPGIRIGDGCAFSGYVTITAVKSIRIDEKVLVARYVYISDHTHECQDRERPILDQGITGVAPVHIKEGAWIGQSVVICPGVTIGRNAVIGANSVVRQDVPDFCVAAGAPARVIRRIDERSQND